LSFLQGMTNLIFIGFDTEAEHRPDPAQNTTC